MVVGPVVLVGTDFDQEVHLQLGNHRGFQPCRLVGGELVERGNLGLNGPLANLVESHRPENATVLVLHQIPFL